MLRDELKEMTIKAMDQKEYNEVVEKMKVAAKSGKFNVQVSNVSQSVISKLHKEGIFVIGGLYSNEETLYVLSWA